LLCDRRKKPYTYLQVPKASAAASSQGPQSRQILIFERLLLHPETQPLEPSCLRKQSSKKKIDKQSATSWIKGEENLNHRTNAL